MEMLLKTLCVLATICARSLTSADPTSGCETVEVPMCKGLVGYNLTRLPNQFNHRTQSEVYWALQPWWPFMDMMCSSNLRVMLCGLYLPKCTPGSARVQLPCRETCRKAKVRCSQEMQRQGRPWDRQFKCPQFLPKKTNRCIKPFPEKKKKKERRHVMCERNTLSMCSSIAEPYTHGSLPNMFLQGNMRMMDLEMQQYQPLIDSGCSDKLRFFLCGVFMPFCVLRRQQEIPFVVPCRELCEEVYKNCHAVFTKTRSGLPWPGKLHCHRYPSYTSMNWSGQNHTIPCTMQPFAGRQQTAIEGRHELISPIRPEPGRSDQPARQPGSVTASRGGPRPTARPGTRTSGRTRPKNGTRSRSSRRASRRANRRSGRRSNTNRRANAARRAKRARKSKKQKK